MSAPFQVGGSPHSPASFSYATSGNYVGRVENTNDQSNNNLIQVRIFGYQDDKINIPTETLEWIPVKLTKTMLPGDTRTQPYAVGAWVTVGHSATGLEVTGASPGRDGEKREQNPDAVNTSPGGKPDTTNPQQGPKAKDTYIQRNAPGLRPTAKHGVEQPYAMENIKKMAVWFDHYMRGRNELPAPFGEGTKALLDTFKSMGHLKLQSKSDILDVIRNMDGNISGAIKNSLDIIRNLRNNGFGTGFNTVGGNNVGAADANFNGDFGNQALNANNLDTLLQALLAAIQMISRLTGATLLDNMNDIAEAANLLREPLFNIDVKYIQDIQDELDKISLAGDNQSVDFYNKEADKIKALFAAPFVIAQNNLNNNKHNQNQQNQGGGGGSGLNSLIANPFIGNPVALQEIASGQLVKDFLSKNPIKYKQDKRNDPKKKFPDKRKGGQQPSATAPNQVATDYGAEPSEVWTGPKNINPELPTRFV